MLTSHNDVARTGLNPLETILTPANVNSSNFGKLFFTKLDGKVDAQPLYVPGVSIPNAGTHNVLIAVTEHDSIYALDADNGAVLWRSTALLAGEAPSDSRNCNQIIPEIGITSTPVINDQTTPMLIYLVAMSKDRSGNYHQRLHALDINSGREQLGGPVNIQAKYPGSGENSQGGYVIFDPAQYAARAGLLLSPGNTTVYIAWTSHCDIRPYTGWILGYSASDLSQTTVLNTTPNGSEGAFWGSGSGVAADPATGSIFIMAGNGTFDTALNSQGFPANGDFGNAFLNISTANNTLQVADYFNMSNTVAESDADVDLGSGGVLVLPDLRDSSGTVWHLAVGAGKDANIYLVNRDNMGKFNPNSNDAIYQDITGALGGPVFSMPAWFNGQIYYGAVGDSLKAFPFSGATLSSTPSSQTSLKFSFPGTTSSISANGSTNGIVWAVENKSPDAVLHAYLASNLASELYNSSSKSLRDRFGPGNKFITPTIVNGKVYVGTPTGVVAFGLLPR
ncbi:MAG: pyrrolo-quinoline quinone [Acidobacteriia bacterium]|nr:pyrrolo-quinoline quinone [Terriglobia bacterium]